MESYNGVIIEGNPYTTYYYKIGERDYSTGDKQIKLSDDQVNLLVGADQEKWVTTEMEDDFGDTYLTYGMYNDWFRRYVSPAKQKNSALKDGKTRELQLRSSILGPVLFLISFMT